MSHITADSTPAEVREHWAAALESGEYDQTAGQLADGDGGFCCLGVACDLAVKAGVIHRFARSHADLDDGYAPVKRWLGLRDGGGGYSDGDRSLAADNDAGETFAEIAATIRSAPENLFAE